MTAPRTMLSSREVAARWGIDVKTIYEAIKVGQLKALRLGRKGKLILVPLAEVEAHECQGRVAPPSEGDRHGGSTR